MESMSQSPLGDSMSTDKDTECWVLVSFLSLNPRWGIPCLLTQSK